MTARRDIKQRSPAVWARVRAAYLAGEPAASVAARFDVGLGNLRFRAVNEGWTRKAAMARAEAEADAEDLRLAGQADAMPRTPVDDDTSRMDPEPDLDPHEALTRATRHAARLLAQGRGAEAAALVKAAQGLTALIEADPTLAAEPQTPEITEDKARTWREGMLKTIMAEAERLAADMLQDETRSAQAMGAFAYHWRARNLGPECAAADYARAASHHWVARYWDAEGRLLPLDVAFTRQWREERHDFGFTGYDEDDPDRMI